MTPDTDDDWQYRDDGEDDRCTCCEGDIWVECDDPIQCCDPRCDGESHYCKKCQRETTRQWRERKRAAGEAAGAGEA